MITGRINTNREAVVTLSLIDAKGDEQHLEAVIDTGFTGELTLPSRLIDDLALSFEGSRSAVLGDGSEILLDTYAGFVKWHGRLRPVIILEAEGGPLLGMELLEGSHLSIHVEEDGIVEVSDIN